MSKRIIIDAALSSETRVAVVDEKNLLQEFRYENNQKKQIRSNIYLAKVCRVEPSLQAVFIEYGNEKRGFLPFSEIHHKYYNIPISDQSNHLHENEKNADNSDIKKIDQEIEDFSHINNVDVDHLLKDSIKLTDKIVDYSPRVGFDDDEIDIEEDNLKDKKKLRRDYKVQEVIKNGQVLLVQLVKEERGNKCASFSTYISLIGKYCILLPNTANHNGVSRKISDFNERQRLKTIIKQLTCYAYSEDFSLVARTASMNRSALEMKKDYDYLVRLWADICKTTIESTAPCFIHAEDDLLKKTIRDLFDNKVKKVIVSGYEAYKKSVNLVKDFSLEYLNKIEEYKGSNPIFINYGIEDQVTNLYQPIVNLSSGGYIVINPTEALTAIDVNSGKSTTERNIEETALRTNLEAAKEIARQLRLRDISGLVVIDFIDMYDVKNKQKIEKFFNEYLSGDSAKIHTSSISSFGLLEMSRQRLRPSFLEYYSYVCDVCNGKGVVRSLESNANLIIRTIENEIVNNKANIINLFANLHVVVYLINNKKRLIQEIENKYNIVINFTIDETMTREKYAIETIKKREEKKEIFRNIEVDVIKNFNIEAKKIDDKNKVNHNKNNDNLDIEKKSKKDVNDSGSVEENYQITENVSNNKWSKKRKSTKLTNYKDKKDEDNKISYKIEDIDKDYKVNDVANENDINSDLLSDNNELKTDEKVKVVTPKRRRRYKSKTSIVN